MNSILQESEKQQIVKLTLKKNIPTFRAGDSLKVTVKIVEGERSRSQAFEGVCIARKNNSINSKFTVRKISHGEGVERVFPLFSPIVEKIEVIKKGDVSKAKLYYLRKRTGKKARIADKDRGDEADQYSMSQNSKLIREVSNNENIKENLLEEDDQEKVNVDENLVKNTKENSSSKLAKESVAEENKSVEEKSESTASQAEKTKDESKS